MHLENTALVLEGGGMRGMFSAGVFEAFLFEEHYLSVHHSCFCRCLQYSFVYV